MSVKVRKGVSQEGDGQWMEREVMYVADVGVAQPSKGKVCLHLLQVRDSRGQDL